MAGWKMAKSCNHVRLLISKCADNEATPEERHKVEAHITRCDECARRLASYVEAAAILSQAAPLTPEGHPPDDVLRVQEPDEKSEGS